jgi:hypothetical protein
LDTLVCSEEEAAAWDMMDMVEIICGSDGDKIGRRLERWRVNTDYRDDKDNPRNCDPKS